MICIVEARAPIALASAVQRPRAGCSALFGTCSPLELTAACLGSLAGNSSQQNDPTRHGPWPGAVMCKTCSTYGYLGSSFKWPNPCCAVPALCIAGFTVNPSCRGWQTQSLQAILTSKFRSLCWQRVKHLPSHTWCCHRRRCRRPPFPRTHEKLTRKQYIYIYTYMYIYIYMRDSLR